MSKAEYGIEVRGLIHRAKDHKLISPDRERSLYIQWSSNGWRTNEPVPVADERPLLLAQALQTAEGKNFAARLSHTIGVPADLISYWTQGASDRRRDSTERAAEVVTLTDRVRRRAKSAPEPEPVR